MSILKKILLPIILFSNSQIFEGSSENTFDDKECIVRLQRINVSNDQALTCIIQEITLQNRDDSSFLPLYVLTMNDYQDGTIIEIVKISANVLDCSRNWDGYILANGCKIVIDKIDSKYVLSEYDPKQIESFKLGSIQENIFITNEEVNYYYVLGDIYAHFSPKDGWIWSDGEPDE